MVQSRDRDILLSSNVWRYARIKVKRSLTVGSRSGRARAGAELGAEFGLGIGSRSGPGPASDGVGVEPGANFFARLGPGPGRVGNISWGLNRPHLEVLQGSATGNMNGFLHSTQ